MIRKRTLGWLKSRAALPLVALLAVASLALGPATPVAAAAAGAPPPITLSFDHLTTGFELDGVHRDLACESCHLNAIFKGTPRYCATCHITGSPYNATPKTATHIMSTNNCAACHNTIAFRPDVHFDHAEVMGSCVSCHNGKIAQGKVTPPHPQTSDDCAACHTVLSWNPPKAVDHTQIPLAVAGYCIICHNGVAASGQNKGHIATNLECGDCHVTTTWLGANFDHTGIISGCYSCHNGTKAVGKQGAHMPTSNTCENCHTTGIGTKAPSWAPSKFDHTQAATPNTCLPCHSGTVKITTGTVSGEPMNHVPLNSATADCVTCHANTPAAETWTVISASIAKLHTGLSVNNCLLCHAGQTFAGVPAPYIPMAISGISPTKSTPLAPPHIPIKAGVDCSACHGAAYTAGGFGPATPMSVKTHTYVSSTCDTCHDKTSFYVGSGTPLQLRPASHVSSNDARMATGDCSGCHETKDWLSTNLPAGHMPNPGNQSCTQCHASAPGDYSPSTLAPIPALHKGITGNCGLCHGDYSTALTFANNFTPKDAILTPAHIPYLSGTDCSSCHATNYATGGFGATTMSAAKHAFVPKSCDTCHGVASATAFYPGGALNLQIRPTDPIHSSGQALTGDCGACHNTTSWLSTVLPAGHMPNPGNLACTVCHINTADYTQLAGYPVLHTSISGNCGQCHGNTTTALTWYNNFTPKDAILSPQPHIPYLSGADCSSCHATNYVLGGFGSTAMNAAKHAFVPTSCDTCHGVASATAFFPGATLNLQIRPTDSVHGSGQALTGDCSGCHNTTSWISTVLPAGHMPNPGNQACTVCHTNAADYSVLAANSVLHTGITAGCQQCHGLTQLTFYNNYSVIVPEALAPPHIPVLSGIDCSSCHSSATYAKGTFGPMNMTQAKHAFVSTTCVTCHEKGLSFSMGAASPPLQGRPTDATHSSGAGSTSDCSACHTTANWNSTALPAGHMPNPGNQACAVCHTNSPPDQVLAANSVLHTGITAGCQQCHGLTQLTFFNNYSAIVPEALSPPHIPVLSGTDCSNCHSSATYAKGTFGPMNMTQAKHAFVSTTCVTCHEKGLSFSMGAASPPLQGRPTDATHSSGAGSTSDCSACHTTANWNSTALPAGHMPNPANQTCSVCHINPADYTQLAGYPALHTGITGNCAQCHGVTQLTFYNNYSKTKSAALTPPHIPFLSGADCSSCHAATFVAGGFVTTMSAGKHAFVSTTCATCHGVTSTAAFYPGAGLNLQIRPTGDGVHTSGQGLTGDCSACHETTDWNSTVMPTGHMPNPGNQACTVCHTGNLSTLAGYTTLASYTVMHTGIHSGCAQCHGATSQLTFLGGFANPLDGVLTPLAHIPFLGGTDCISCHTANYVAKGFGPATAMSAATHAFVSTTCDTCHGTATAQYSVGSGTALQLRPKDSTHSTGTALTGDCSGCHTTANWNSTAFPANHMPNPANQTCSVCHTNASNYAIVASNPILHTGITSGCITCHAAPNGTPPVYAVNFTPMSAVHSPPHIPTGITPCESCHTVSFTSFGNTTMTAAKHTTAFAYIGSTCDACHNRVTPALNFWGVNNLQVRPQDGDHNSGNGLTADCSRCHNVNGWGGGAAVKKTAAKAPTRSTIAQVAGAPAAASRAAALAPGDIARSGSPLGGRAQLGTLPGSALVGTAQVGTAQLGTPAATAALGTVRLAAAPGLSHAGVTGNCATCHNGVLATGKGPTHIASNNTCENCHTTLAWLPARFDHQGVTARCASCHNGALALGKPTLHVQTQQDCGTCHNTINWTSVTFSHFGVLGTCQSCHNGVTATGKQIQHVQTTLDCSNCHNTFNWTITTPPPNRLKPLIPSLRGPTRGPAP